MDFFKYLFCVFMSQYAKIRFIILVGNHHIFIYIHYNNYVYLLVLESSKLSQYLQFMLFINSVAT